MNRAIKFIKDVPILNFRCAPVAFEMSWLDCDLRHFVLARNDHYKWDVDRIISSVGEHARFGDQPSDIFERPLVLT